MKTSVFPLKPKLTARGETGRGGGAGGEGRGSSLHNSVDPSAVPFPHAPEAGLSSYVPNLQIKIDSS